MHQTNRRERSGKTLIDRPFAWGNVNFKPNVDLSRSFLFEDAPNDNGFSNPVTEMAARRRDERMEAGLPPDSDVNDEPDCDESDDNADEHFQLNKPQNFIPQRC